MAFQIKVNKINTTRSISDLIGIAISFICAVQCAMAPIILSIAPVIPGWAHFGHGWIWISLIFIIAIWSIGRGYFKHKNTNVLWIAGVGLSFLLAGTLLEDKLTILSESAIFVIGGLLLTVAHWKNYKLEGACSN
jgi:hypothetical protein